MVTTLDCISPGEVTNFQWYVESAIGVTDTSSIDSTMSSLESISSFILYPNPFSEGLYLPNQLVNNQCEVSVYDISGKLLFSKLNSGQFIELSHLSSGMYLIHVSKDGELISSQKVIKW